MQAKNMCGRMQFLLKGTMPKVLTATLQSMYEDCSDYYLTVFHNHLLTSCATPDTDIIILDRIGGSMLQDSALFICLRGSGSEQWAGMRLFEAIFKPVFKLFKTPCRHFPCQGQSLNSRYLILQRYHAISSRVPVNVLDEGKEPVLTAVGRYVAWNPNFQRQNPCIPGQSVDCPLWTSQSCMNQFYPILSFVSQSDEAGPISQEAIKCASIRQRPSSPSSKDLPQRKSTGSLSIY